MSSSFPNSTSNPNSAHAATPSLYVGDLAPDITEATLLEIFRQCGVVASVRVCRDSVTRRSLGYAYVNFHRLEDAERALDTLNYESIKGRPCRIMWSHRDPSLRRSGNGNIFVKNLDPNIDSKQLYDTFSIFGNILSCKVSTNRETGESLGYGFVHYASEDAAAKAISKVHGRLILNRQVDVEIFKAKTERGETSVQFTNVFVKNLPVGYTEEKLKEFMSKFGEITSVMVNEKTLKLTKKDEEGVEQNIEKKSCYGFVNFVDSESAEKCVAGCENIEIEGREIYVGRALRKEDREQLKKEQALAAKVEKQKQYNGVNLYVRNFSDDMNDIKLREIFSEYGTITASRVMKNDEGKTKGFGFVCFSTPEEAQKAIAQTNGKMVDGKPLYVALYQPKAERKAQLEAYHNARQKAMGPQGQGMYNQGPNPMYGNVPRMVFPQQMAPWNPQQMAPPQGNPMNMMRGPMNYQLMPQMNGQNPQQQGQYPPQMMPMMGQQPGPQSVNPNEKQQGGLDVRKLAKLSEEERTQMIGETLFPRVRAICEPSQAGKITGMLLEMDNSELLMLLDSEEALKVKVNEAIEVLANFQQQTQA